MEDDAEAAVGPDDGYLLVRIHVPELNVHKCLQFPKDQLVWDVKQQCLAALPKELKESFNYGLFCPPVNGKAGKFLDEERRLGDYPFNGPVGYLELKAKRRVYKMVNLDEKQLKALHTRTNLRRFLEYVTNAQVEKINKMCSKGLDPNFHCPETGETPLTMATGVRKPTNVLKALVNGGALLDFRSKDGSTAVHRAVEHNSLEAVTTLLELGASPNYRDCKGLTPLYVAITHSVDPLLCETLLHNRAVIGAQDLQGWQEVHQACRNGLVQHLEHLLYYGADMNARNASGNTPLHVCAVNGQESCARVLLFRGCQHDALNYANQTPYQVAVIAGNLDLADVIQAHRPENVVPFRELPRYNPRRRSMLPSISHTIVPLPPPSPSLSARSFPPFSSASSSLSETSSGSAKTTTTEDTASYITDKSLCDTSDIISDSSGVGTANSDSLTLPGTSVVCVENYSSSQPGHLRLSQGDILDGFSTLSKKWRLELMLTGTTDCGLLEGTHRNGGETGLFPPHCVQEVRLRGGLVPPPQLPVHRRVVGRRESNATSLKHFATAPRHKKQLPAEPRTVVLHRARRGFGFVLRGAKATSPLMELTPSARYPALQYLDDVDKGGVADMAGLRKNDYLLAINGEDVSAASHEHVVDLIRKSGDLVSLTVVSSGALPSSKSAAAGLTAGQENQPTPRQYQTLPRKLNNNFPTLGRAPAPLPPRRDPKTTLSVGRARAKSMVAEEEAANSGDSTDPGKVQPRTASIRARPTSSRITAAELESLFQRQTPYMMTTSNFQAGGNSQPSSPARTPRVYASVAEMKRSKGKANTRVRFSLAGIGMAGVSELHRDFHSTPDLAAAVNGAVTGPRQHHSQEELRPLPPPSQPPPPPPAAPDTGNDTGNGGDGVMSSFKPAASAKLYASPEDVKNVGYRSRSLPSHANRPQVRKSHSLRSPSSSFKPAPGSQGANPYAQPIRNRKQQPVSAPPIPDPDYSLSENESDTEPADKTVIRVNQTEGSGGSSTSSGSLPHSFSVDEIQKVRTQLKSSKSYPNDFIPGAEDGDNSSSGVSSDQEIPAGPPSGFDVNQESSTGTSTLPRTSQRSALTRNAVSLAQLPPPLEADTDEREELVVPPPPEYAGGVGPVMEEVLAPPPQFSDGRLVTRVRIVGSTPKAAPSRLHSQ
ncbi:SH3 and multiple ankyrin repeat domains protein 3-like isoform X2 [Macrosteles quadrilineatus]|uniref:SH3 and multiple ankyrin repeat domains protein 3-like isoform X2 n=1 Tax=Macrosteles quadrilineatus TaxID=74068 RepID=UPI0023E205B0|nr:SH3 and multiple ankyrin repeat domains protein 3-like isoform X2 [Macrosteles quadrilineatus]